MRIPPDIDGIENLLKSALIIKPMRMEIKENVSLKNLNTFNVHVTAKRFAVFSNRDELEFCLSKNTSEPAFILGGGSNVLFIDRPNGLVLKNSIQGIEVINETEDEVFIKAGAGEIWHRLVMFCVENDFAGIENLSLIPGSVGAAPMQNIGAYGVELKEVFWQLEAFHLKDKHTRVFHADECEFGYRDSVFKQALKNQYVILNVTLRLAKKPNFNISYGALERQLHEMGVTSLTSKSISDAVIAIRKSKLPDPALLPNAGSFFKNPIISRSDFQQILGDHPGIPSFDADPAVKIPAAWLIERCGFKGYREGDVGCHINQPLVLVNYGNATGEEILSFSKKVTDTVKDKFGIALDREVNVVP